MNNYQQDIERYLNGEMTSAEQRAFEQQRTTDTALAEAYEAELSARNWAKDAGRLELKKKLQQVDAQMLQETPAQMEAGGKVLPLWIKRVLPIAAMVIIFLGVYQFMVSGSLTTSEVYDTYYTVYESPSVLRDSGDESKINWETAARLYSERKYREAIPYFSKAEAEVPQYLAAFYKGMSNLNLDGPYYTRAIAAFDTVLQTDNDYREQAQWYKALALLQIQQKEEATALLKTIVENKSYNYQNAEDILKLKLK